MLPSAICSLSFDCDVAMARDACTAAVYQLLLLNGVEGVLKGCFTDIQRLFRDMPAGSSFARAAECS
jgi:hypothetical protein